MNLYLHGIGSTQGSHTPITEADALAQPSGRIFDMILANPLPRQRDKKGGYTILGDDGKITTEKQEYERTDFCRSRRPAESPPAFKKRCRAWQWATTSNKQLNFLQHIVSETKNYRGWIFGKPGGRKWTQKFRGHSSRFQNPLHQNKLHTRALMAALGLPEDAFHSVVYFAGDSTFKTPMPGKVLRRGLVSYLRSPREAKLSLEEIAECGEILGGFADASPGERQAHRRQVRERSADSCLGGPGAARTTRPRPVGAATASHRRTRIL